MYICVCTWAYKYTFSLVPLGLCSVYIYGHALTVYGHAHAIYRHGTAHVLTCGVVAVLLPSARLPGPLSHVYTIPPPPPPPNSFCVVTILNRNSRSYEVINQM